MSTPKIVDLLPAEQRAQLETLAAEDMRSLEQEAAYLILEGLKRRQDKVSAKERKRKSRAGHVTVTGQSRDGHVTPPLVGSFPSPTPPSNPPNTPPYTRTHEGTSLETDSTPVLEEIALVVKESSAAGPDLSRPATPAPKPSRRRLVGEDDPRFQEFRAAYRGVRAKGWADALAVWNANGCSSDEVFPLVMACLAEDNAAPDWVKEQGAYIPAPVVWLRRRRWLDARFAEKTLAVAPVRTAAEDAFRAYYITGKERWTDAQLVDYWVRKINHDLEAALDEEALLAMLAAEGLMPTLRQVDRLGREASERKQVRHA